jgi:SAM-dependent methyltransferase
MQAFRLLLGEDSVLAYLAMMAPRLKELHRALKPTGSIYLHCDPRASHHLKLLMDAIFGRENYRNEVIWCYGGRGAKARARQFPRNHDVILVYSKRSGRQTYNRQHTQRALAPAEARARGLRQDTFGRWFKTSPRGDYTDDSIRRLEADGRIHRTKTGAARVKYFLPAKGGLVVEELLVGDTWLDIPDAMHIGKERVGYPTQKPRALLERIVKTSSNEGEVVLDPFCGSGTTIVAAEALGRRWIGIDNASLAIELTQRRLREAFGETVEQGDDYEVVEESHSDRGSAA